MSTCASSLQLSGMCAKHLETDRILPQAFSFHTEVRHVQVEAGIRVVGKAAWRSCQRLQVVHLPHTVAQGVSQMLPITCCVGQGQAIRHQGL